MGSDLDLRWTEYTDKRGVATELVLRCGGNSADLATLVPSATRKTWSVCLWLPNWDLEDSPHRYRPLAEQRTFAEERVKRWFSLALGVQDE